MNWFSALAAIAIVCTAYLGADHPSRTIILELFIALIAIIGLGFEWWKESRASATEGEAVGRP
jgi:hypothetical protein